MQSQTSKSEGSSWPPSLLKFPGTLKASVRYSKVARRGRLPNRRALMVGDEFRQVRHPVVDATSLRCRPRMRPRRSGRAPTRRRPGGARRYRRSFHSRRGIHDAPRLRPRRRTLSPRPKMHRIHIPRLRRTALGPPPIRKQRSAHAARGGALDDAPSPSICAKCSRSKRVRGGAASRSTAGVHEGSSVLRPGQRVGETWGGACDLRGVSSRSDDASKLSS